MSHKTQRIFGMLFTFLLLVAPSARAEAGTPAGANESKPSGPDVASDASGPPAPAPEAPQPQPSREAPEAASPAGPTTGAPDIRATQEGGRGGDALKERPSARPLPAGQTAASGNQADAGPAESRSLRETEPAKPPDSSLLKVETDPPGAVVTIGYSDDVIDQEVGETPINLQVVAATYYLTLRKEGYETATAKVIVNAGETSWLRVRLAAEERNRVRAVRLAGNLVFWPGLATAVVGIMLIVVDDPAKDRDTGKPGFGLVAAGVTMVVAGGLMLGLTYRDRGVYTMPDANAQTSSPPGLAGRQGMLTLTESF
jgi:hypothetical protein